MFRRLTSPPPEKVRAVSYTHLDVYKRQQSDRGIAHQLIVDGHVSSYNLSLVGKTEIWLKKRIKAYGFESFKDVYLFTLDDAGGEYILKKNK